MKKFGKLLATILAILLVVGLLPVYASAEGTATQETQAPADSGWTAISSVDELKNVGGGNYYLTGNIDCGGQTIDKAFSGNFDGRGYSITNFEGNLFYTLAYSAPTTITNLTLGSADAPITASPTANFGFLAETYHTGATGMRPVVIENVTVYGNATATGNVSLGGIIGLGREISIINSKFIGTLTAESGTVGGLVGHLDKTAAANTRMAVIKNSEVDATLSGATVGGIIGKSEFTTLVDKCEVKGTVGTDASTTVGGVVGSVDVGSDGVENDTMHFVATACTTANATVTGNKVWGAKAGDTTRVYVRGCDESQDTEEKDIKDITDATVYDYVWTIDHVDDFANVKALGFYKLTADIDMDAGTTKEWTQSVVNLHFGGVFDGNGKAVYDFVMKPASSGTNKSYHGFFYTLSNSGAADSVVVDFDLGTSESYVQLSDSGRAHGGILAGRAGVDEETDAHGFSAIVSGVNVYENVTLNSNAQNFGALFGTSLRFGCYDCNVYGSVDSKSTQASYLGGLVARSTDSTNIARVFYNCNNFADLSVVASSNKASYLGGIMAMDYVNGVLGTTFVKCSNFGALNNGVTTTSSVGANAGGMLGFTNSTITVIYCNNFGKITSKNSAAGVVGSHQKDEKITISNFGQYGNISGAASAELVNVNANGGTINTFSCTSGKLLKMEEGASVRISENSGLRFKSYVSMDVLSKLEEVLTASGKTFSIERGIIISPETFVNGAGAFTRAALDAYSNAPESNLGGTKAYVEIDSSNEWFDNKEGTIVGSIIPEIGEKSYYDTNFCGVSYLTVMVDGKAICNLYASDYQTRSICEVAKKALADTYTTVTTTDDGSVYDQQLEGGETYYERGTLAEKTVAEGETVFSCYTKARRDILKSIIEAHTCTLNAAE